MDIWLYDLERGLSRRQTFEGEHDAQFVVWGPGPDRFSFTSRRGPAGAFSKLLDTGPGEVKALASGGTPASWTRDGQYLAVLGGEQNSDVLVFSEEGGSKPYVATRFSELSPEFSPDGRWLLYTSDEQGPQDYAATGDRGSYQVYVVGYPEKGAAMQISIEGGYAATWSRDGREIYFLHQRQLYVATVREEDSLLRPSRPKVLIDFPYSRPFPLRGYDPLPDGRFAVIKAEDEATAEANRRAEYPDRFHVVQNWFAELEERVPTGRAGQ